MRLKFKKKTSVNENIAKEQYIYRWHIFKYNKSDLSFYYLMEYSNLKNDDIVYELYRRFRCIELNKNKRIVFLGVPGAGLKINYTLIGKGTHSFKLS